MGVHVIWEKVIDASCIVVSPRPVWKCRMCSMYGKRLSCPPFVPSWRDAKEWISFYKEAVLYKFSINMDNFEDEKRSTIEFLLERERSLFKEYPFVYALFPGSCNLCSKCPFETGGKCLKPTLVRPALDALGIEITSITHVNFSENVLYSLVFLE